MNTGNNIPQTTSAKSEVDVDTFPQTRLEEFKAVLDSQACYYYPRLIEDKISQQSADQLPWLHINPVEFDGIRMQAELLNLEPKKEEQP